MISPVGAARWTDGKSPTFIRRRDFWCRPATSAAKTNMGVPRRTGTLTRQRWKGFSKKHKGTGSKEGSDDRDREAQGTHPGAGNPEQSPHPAESEIDPGQERPGEEVGRRGDRRGLRQGGNLMNQPFRDIRLELSIRLYRLANKNAD